MRTPTLLFALLVVLSLSLAVSLTACGETPPQSPEPAVQPDGLEFQETERAVGGFVVAAGQPSEARLRELAPHVGQIVSLRMPSENPYDEAALAKTLGIPFTQIGIDKARLQDPAVREQVFVVLDAAAKEDGITYLHCGSSNRVGALWALWRIDRESMPLAEAIIEGKRAGLTTLEPLVREIAGKQ